MCHRKIRRIGACSTMLLHIAIRAMVAERRSLLAERTAITYEATARAIQKTSPSLDSKTLTQVELDDYARRRSVRCTIRTVARELTAIRTALRRLGQWKLDATFRVPRPREPRGKKLNNDELQRIRVEIYRIPHREILLAVMELALETGVRSGEVRKLQVQDIDLAQRIIRVNGTKTAWSRRTIPISKQLAIKLASFTKEKPPEAPLFGDASGPWSRGLVEKQWRLCCKKAGLAGTRLHDLRHTAITRMCERGTPDFVIRAIAGHADNQTLRTYSHVQIEAMRAALAPAQPKPEDAADTKAQVKAALLEIFRELMEKFAP